MRQGYPEIRAGRTRGATDQSVADGFLTIPDSAMTEALRFPDPPWIVER